MNTANGKVAIVTGASAGIGKASAVALLKAGYSVVFAGRRQAELEDAVAGAGEQRVGIGLLRGQAGEVTDVVQSCGAVPGGGWPRLVTA